MGVLNPSTCTVFPLDVTAGVSCWRIRDVRHEDTLDLSTAYSQILGSVGVTLGSVSITPSTARYPTVTFTSLSTGQRRTVYLLVMGDPA